MTSQSGTLLPHLESFWVGCGGRPSIITAPEKYETDPSPSNVTQVEINPASGETLTDFQRSRGSGNTP